MKSFFRRNLATLLIAAMLLTSLPISATAASVEEDYQYTILTDGSVQVNKYYGSDSTVVIPDTIEGYPVVSIRAGAFYNKTFITDLTIPEGIITIEEQAFWGCSGLKTISIPRSLVQTGKAAFGECVAISDVYYGGTKEEWYAISFYEPGYIDGIGYGYDSYLLNANIHFRDSIKFGADRLSFGVDITGYVGDEIDSLVVYTSANGNIASLDIKSSNTDIVEIGTIEIGVGDYITSENEHMATIPLKLKKKGNATITIVSPENISTSITVSVEQVTYEIKMYSEIPTLVVGEGRTIGAALQLERNGTLVDDTCKYSFVSSNTEVITVSNVRNEKDGVYFYINGHKSGVAKLTVTETNTGAIYSTLVQVNDGVITYNAEALPTYYDRDAECNGFVNGMYMDEFSSTQKNNTTLSVSFNVYNTTSLVGVVDVYDKNNKLVNTYPIKRYDGGIISSVYETIKEGYYLIKDVVTGDILTYKQSSYSQKTEIKNIDVPIGGRIEITNDINYSDSCCILNVTELSITTILTVGDTIKGLSSSEIKKIAEESSVTILKNEIGSKLPEIASEFREKIIKSIAGDAGDVIVADALNIASDNALNIFELFDIDFTKLVVDSAASLGVGIAEDAFVAATAFIGATLKGMFIVADYLELSCFIMQIAIPRSDKAMKIYFDDENGCLVSNGVSIKSQNGTTSLSENNFILHSVVLSNDADLTNEVKNSLDNISNEYVVRDIYLERDGVVSQPGQTVQVYMPIPDNYDSNKCKLYWVKDDGTLEQKDFTIIGNNIMFTTDHFSYWALVNDAFKEEATDALCGDFDQSGTVTDGDALYLLRHTLFEDRYPISQSGDVDGDGKVTDADALYLLRYTLFPDRYPLQSL